MIHAYFAQKAFCKTLAKGTDLAHFTSEKVNCITCLKAAYAWAKRHEHYNEPIIKKNIQKRIKLLAFKNDYNGMINE